MNYLVFLEDDIIMTELISGALVTAIRQVLQDTRYQLQRTVNTSMVNAY